MPVAKDTVTRNKAKGLLESHWRPKEVARKLPVSRTTAYRWEQRMQLYNGELTCPKHLQMKTGRPSLIHAAAERSLLEYIARCPWIYQDEMVLFLAEEWGIETSRSAVGRLIKRVKIRNKRGQRIGHTQSQPLRIAWQAQMQDITAEQMVFIDESLFKQQTGWRLMAYGPIGSPARYADDTARGNTWSILPAYTVDGYLPCTGIRLGFFDGDAFVSWVLNELLPYLRPFPEPHSVICLDNLNVHLDPRVQAALEERGCLIKFLPPYSPDYNPIELTFSMLKAWMRRHFRSFRQLFQGDFGGFLRFAIAHSNCDRKAQEHFRYAAGGYKFEGDYDAFQVELERWSQEQDSGSEQEIEQNL